MTKSEIVTGQSGSKNQVLSMGQLEARIRDKERAREMKRGQIGRYSLTVNQVKDLFSKIDNIRDLSLLKLAVFTGIRREDIVSIERSSIDWDNGVIRFYEQKKRRPWKVYINPETSTTLKMYEKTLSNHQKYLFPGRYYGPRSCRGPRPGESLHLTGRAAYNILQTWLKVAGLDPRPFHALRSTCIKLLSSKGWTTEQIMDQTGDTLETIQLHYTVPTTGEMAELAKRTEF